MSSLYELAGELAELMRIIDDEENEYSDECLIDTWEALDYEFEAKVEGWCKCILNKQAYAENLKAEIERLQNKKRREEKAVMKMKSVLAEMMSKAEKPKIKTALFNVNRLKLNGKLDVDTRDVPKELRKEQISMVPDNDKIRDMLDKGEELSFARYYNSITIQ